MTLMKIRGLQKAFGDKTILNDINLDIKKGSRIGLVGNNGTGKSTLANIIAGRLTSDSGTIETYTNTIKMGYLVQATEYTIHDFEAALTSTDNKDIFLQSSQLGLSKLKNWDIARLENLSGGEKTKLSIAKIWASNPELLILDEPTNHLDFNGINWLIHELKSFKGAVLIISHDRYFLDESANEIVEIENGKNKVFYGNYSAYRDEKERQYQQQLHQYEVQQKYKEQIENQLANLQNWSEKAHKQSTKHEFPKEYYRVKAKAMDKQVKSKRKRLEKELEKNKFEKPKEEVEIRFHFTQSDKRGKRIIEATDIEKRYGGRILFQNSHFYLKYGERIGLIGENGCGKTTLLRILLDQEKLTSGELWKSHSLKIGYLSQDVTDMDETSTPLEYFGITDRDEISRARTILANTGLSARKIDGPIEQLSLGERTRIKLVRILLEEVDLLILDEPTNHLDLASRENLESTLQDFSGTILIVSHDFYFLKKMCEKLLVIENNLIKRLEMTIEEYQKKDEPKEERNLEEEKLLLDNEISVLIGEISLLSKNDPEYETKDKRLSELLRKKRELMK